MVESHESYSRCGLGHEKTDEIVNALKTAGPERGIYGAKITGGGSGGTVCAMCQTSQGLEAVQHIAEQTTENPMLILGSSHGARWRVAGSGLKMEKKILP